MIVRVFLLLLLTPFLVPTVSSAPRLLFSDEFNEDSLDLNSWSYDLGDGCPNLCGWGNNEWQSYTKKNVTTVNNHLVISATKQGDAYYSGRITSKDKFEFTYGTIEVKAQLPIGKGLWPAIWMLGHDIDTNTWPACGEIDIMEQFEDKSYVQSTCHWQSPSTTNYAPVSYGLPVDLNTPTEFHIYSLIWSEGSIKTLLDGNQFYAMNTNSTMPFDANFFFIFNVAMGGTNGGTIDPNFTSDAMEVDYIRVYQ